MIDFLDRGVLMDEAGGADAGGGGMDTGADLGGSGAESTELAVIDTESVDDATDDLDTGEPSTELAKFRPTDDSGRLTKQAQTALAPLKQTAPALYRQIHKNQGIVNRLFASVPAGVNPFDAIKNYQRIFKELGGEQGIQEIRAQLAEMEDVDLLFAGADPQVLDKYLMAEPSGKAAIMKLLPHVVARLENVAGGPAAILGLSNKIDELRMKLTPNAANKKWAQTIQNALIQSDIDVHFRRMEALIPATDEIGKASVTAIGQWLTAIKNMTALEAEVLPAAPAEVKEPDTLSEERRQFEKEKIDSRRENWGQASNSLSNSTFEKAWAEQSKGRKLTPKDKENIAGLVGLRMGIVYKNISGYSQERNRLFQANDRAGFLRYMQNVYSKNIPRVLKAEIAGYGGAKPAAATTATPGVPGAARVTPQVGFRTVAAQPPSNHIDHRPTATTREMFLKGQASIKPEYRHIYGGAERVQWAKKR